MKDCGQKWWKEAKFGMFIHWGLYSELGGIWKGERVKGHSEWIKEIMNIPNEEYEAVAKRFNPVEFNAKEWVQLAVDAGMKYLVITAKHHDGFAMYHSRCNPYNIVDATPFGIDPMAELAEECRKAGIRLCFYYSQALDWQHPDAFGHGEEGKKGRNFDRYLEEKCKPQLKELLTQYGPIGVIWFDMPGGMSMEQSRELKEYVKSLQPDCIVSGRIGNGLGDYMTSGDNQLPYMPFDGDWEIPSTMNDTWGYKEFDHNWKKPEDLMRLLLKINGRGGNYLLNVGPDGKGRIPEECKKILRRVGSYVKRNGDAFYGTSAVHGYPYELKDLFFTAKPHHLYIHTMAGGNNYDGSNTLVMELINSKIKHVTDPETGEELRFTQPINEAEFNQWGLVIELPKRRGEICQTVDLEIEDEVPVFGSLEYL